MMSDVSVKTDSAIKRKKVGKSAKNWIKSSVALLCMIVISPLYLSYRLLGLFAGRDGLFASYSQLISLIPGKTGSYLRNSFYRLAMTRCDDGIVFSFGTLFSQRDTEIGTGTYIGPQGNFGSCAVGKDCLIGSGVHVLSGKHQHAIDDLDTPIRDQGGALTKVRIGDDCWIGNCAVIMSDIGNQCVVAAGSVVVDSVTDRSIVGGNPARVMKERINSDS